jgi:hypothetical protein
LRKIKQNNKEKKMSKGIKIKLDTLYATECASELSPAHYTPATVEVFSASSDVTVRGTTNPDFDGTASELPAVGTASQGDVLQCDLTRSVRFLSFSCSDSSAEIYVSGFRLDEVPVEENSGDDNSENNSSESEGE